MVDLAAVAERAVAVAQAVAQGQDIALAADGAPLWVSGDARRLEDVVLNLLTNAIKYAPGTARIDVQVERMAGEAALQVRDQGPGIAAADLPHIFSRF